METSLNKLYDRLYGGIKAITTTVKDQEAEKTRVEQLKVAGQRKYESEKVRIKNEIKSAKLYGKYCWLLKKGPFLEALVAVVNEPDSGVLDVRPLEDHLILLLAVKS